MPKRVLKECRVFEALSDADLEKVAALAVPREYEAGTTVFTVGSPAESLYVVEQGKVALQMQLPLAEPLGARRVTVDVVTRGETFGWSAVLERRRYTLTALCVEPTRVATIDGMKLIALLQENHRIGYEVMSHLIDVVASRLDETRRILVSERLVFILQ